ncbi:hypothetical protein [Haloarchaeobius sp. DT45]|uniref:hypothetical protein n=1 Tax=Haloarchaeobius sp. DT45 TaxID=3446116 RepID=UPI003F6A79DA
MVAFYLLARLAVVVGYYLLRLLPVVGHWLARSYDQRLFGPVDDRLAIAAVSATRDGDVLEVAVAIENALWVDLAVAGCAFRIARQTDDATLSHVVWPPAFDTRPGWLASDPVPAEGQETIRVTTVLSGGEQESLTVDGSLVFQPSFSVGDRTFALGRYEFPVTSHDVSV